MKFFVAALIGLSLGSLAHADHGAPSAQVLADMGLASLEVLSDEDALAVRGLGVSLKDGVLADSLAAYRQNIAEFRQRVNDFKTRSAGRTPTGEASYRGNIVRYRANAESFHGRIGS